MDELIKILEQMGAEDVLYKDDPPEDDEIHFKFGGKKIEIAVCDCGYLGLVATVEDLINKTQHIRELGLSIRALNFLVQYGGIETVSELRLMSRHDLLKIPGIGKRSVTEIIDKLHTLNKG